MASEDSPLARVKAAISGKPAKAYARVLAADVVELSKSVPAERHLGSSLDLARGAAGALAERPLAQDPGEIEVFQVAGQLAMLVGLAEAASREPVREGA